MTLEEAKKNYGKRVKYVGHGGKVEYGELLGNLGPDHLLINVRFESGRTEYIWPEQLEFADA